jgi:hypothetical protein
MLPARYSLHDVDDVEQFAVVVLRGRIRMSVGVS